MTDAPQDPDFTDVSGGVSSNAIRTYTVARGDTLSKIARQVYGEARLWPLIHQANADRIRDPDRIQPGWVLTIPPKP